MEKENALEEEELGDLLTHYIISAAEKGFSPNKVIEKSSDLIKDLWGEKGIKNGKIEEKVRNGIETLSKKDYIQKYKPKRHRNNFLILSHSKGHEVVKIWRNEDSEGSRAYKVIVGWVMENMWPSAYLG